MMSFWSNHGQNFAPSPPISFSLVPVTTMKIQRGDSSYESALEALLSPGLHQATTPEEIARAARRRTRTVSDMRFYWRKLLRRHPPGPTPPHRRPLLLHITGTKGKGSTACLCEAVLRAHGYATGLFTSHHLIDVRERIRWHACGEKWPPLPAQVHVV